MGICCCLLWMHWNLELLEFGWLVHGSSVWIYNSFNHVGKGLYYSLGVSPSSWSQLPLKGNEIEAKTWMIFMPCLSFVLSNWFPCWSLHAPSWYCFCNAASRLCCFAFSWMLLAISHCHFHKLQPSFVVGAISHHFPESVYFVTIVSKLGCATQSKVLNVDP